jgi:hypothetical protein
LWVFERPGLKAVIPTLWPWSRPAWPATDRRQDVVDIYTTLDGGSMKLQTGRKFEFRGWAAGK